MDYIISAGVIIYRLYHGTREYLLLRSRKGHWDFPKGKQDPGESVVQTALRELREETGIVVTHVDGPLTPIKWMFKEQGVIYHKQGIFYIGSVAYDTQVSLSAEHTDFVWLPYKEALEKLRHGTSQQLLIEAHQYPEIEHSNNPGD